MHSRVFRSFGAVTTIVSSLVAGSLPALAADPIAGPTIAGTITDVATGLAVNGATVTLYLSDVRVSETKSDANGAYVFMPAAGGAYHIEVRATGYVSNRSNDLFLQAGQKADIRTTVERSSESSSSLREIARVSTANATLQTSSTVVQTVSPERLLRENYTRAADALGTLPGITLPGLDSAIGDDVYVNIRGLKATETQTLIDGHPVGPLGVIAGQGGSENFGGYDQDLSPYFALRSIDVNYGASNLAASVYGPDGTGGSIDFKTLDPTVKPQFVLQQGIGNQGRLSTVLTGQGTFGKIGVVLSHGVQGTYGQFAPGPQLQTAFLGQDLSSGGISDAGALYPVSGNYLLHQDLAKARIAFSPATNLTLTAYVASEFDDKTGNGDNDALGSDTRLATIMGGLGKLNTFTDPVSMQTQTCVSGQVAVKTNAGLGCESPRQFALQTSGPNGGGSSRFQTIVNQDFAARFETLYAGNDLTGDVFIDRYAIDTQRTANVDSNHTSSFGYAFADDIQTSPRNIFGFGAEDIHQRLDGDNLNPGQTFVNKNVLGQAEQSIFVREEFTPVSRVSVLANLYVKNDSVVPDQNRIDPRLSIVGRVTPNDVVRLSAARTQGYPSIYALQGSPTFGSAGSAHYACGGLTLIGSVPATSLLPEDGKEVDVSYGHRFGGDNQIQVNLYDTNVANPIFSGQLPLTSVAGGATNPGFLANYNDTAAGNGYAGFYRTQCNTTATPANFSVASTFNAGSEKAQGIELSGRYRVNPRVFFDYFYDVQDAVFSGISDINLMNNLTAIDGAQIAGIPRNRAGLAVDASDGKGAELRIDGFYTGANNSLNGPPYAQFNGSLSKTFKEGTTINFGIQNIFNNDSGAYGIQGDNVFVPENQYGTDVTSVDQYNNGSGPGERFFLPPRSFQINVTQRVR